MLNFFVKRPIAVSMLYSAIVLLGIISLSKLKVSLFPNIVFPRLTVLTPYGNIAPEEIENLVTRPIEDALSSVNGVTRITSRSQEGVSLVDVSPGMGTVHGSSGHQYSAETGSDSHRPASGHR